MSDYYNVKFYKKWRELYNLTSTVRLEPQSWPVIHFIYQPRREFAEFINYFASACDLWLDLIALAGIGSLIKIILIKFRRDSAKIFEATQSDALFQAQFRDLQAEVSSLREHCKINEQTIFQTQLRDLQAEFSTLREHCKTIEQTLNK